MTPRGSEPTPARQVTEVQTAVLDTQDFADSDQTLSDRDQTLSDRDQSASERDQMASDSDQAAADRDFAAHAAAGTAADLPDYHLSRVQRLSGTSIRHETRENRTAGATERDLNSVHRDENSALRDQVGDRLDAIRETTDLAATAGSGEAKEILKHLAGIRSRGSDNRNRAAKDRARAAIDRRQAAADRRRAELTFQASLAGRRSGGLTRGVGDIALENQIRRARIQRNDLTVIDLAVEDDRADMDERTREMYRILEKIKAVLPPGNPVLRNGDSGFIFAIEGKEESQEQLEEILAGLDFGFAIGKAEMDEDDTLSTLIDRARKQRLAQQADGEAEA